MKTTYRGIKLNGTKEQIEWFWGLTSMERQTVARGVKRHGLSKEYERQKELIKISLHRIANAGRMTESEFGVFNYLESKLAAF